MSVTSVDKIHEALHRIEGSKSSQQAINELMVFVKPFGFKRYFVGQFVKPGSPATRPNMTFSNYPDVLVQDRVDKLNLLRDPVVQYGVRTVFPFSWEKAYAHADRYGLKVAERVWEHDIRQGYMFPLRRPGVPFGAMTLGGSKVDISKTELSNIYLLALTLFSKLEAFAGQVDEYDPIELSLQERDVLQYASAGKTTDEIAIILGIKSSSVKDAFMRARQKLDAMNTTHATALAIAKNLIVP